MIFDLHPKETTQFLYGRDEVLNNVLNHLENRRWISLFGPRMVGKTSIAKVAGHSLRKVKFDSLYVSLWGTATLNGFLDAILSSLWASKSLYQKVGKQLARIEALNVGPVGVTVAKGAKPVSLTWQILTLLGANAKRLVVILDEVQELGAVSVHLLKILANLFSTYPNITFCFTGSQSGILRALHAPSSASPLYGRSPAPITIDPFDAEAAKKFLRAGFSEYGRIVSDSALGQVVERFGGIAGWLTFYGNAVAVSGLDHKRAMRICEKDAFKTAHQTLVHHLEGRKKKQHVLALRAIALGASWAEIRRAIEANTGEKLNDGSLKNILDSLMTAFIVEKREGAYGLIDPVLRRYLLSGRIEKTGLSA